MKQLLTATALLLLLTGCSGLGTYPDKMNTTRVKKDQLIIFRCDDSYFGTDRWRRMHGDTDQLSEIAEGEFAVITADVTYLSGGIEGYQNEPQINRFRDLTPITLEEVKEIYTVPVLTEQPENVAWQLYLWEYEDAEYYLFFRNGDGYLYQDSECLGVFEKLSHEENVLDFLESALST